MEQEKPYLVQRLKEPYETEPDNGVDGVVGMDYMGSAEFEFGTLPKSLKKMRENLESFLKEPKRIKIDGVVCWYWGRSKEYETAKALVADQIQNWSNRHWSLKERTRMRETLLPQDKREEEQAQGPFSICGWWALDAEIPFVIMRNKARCRMFRDAVKNGKKD